MSLDPSEDRDAAHARLNELMAVGEAERTVADVRMADLKAAHAAAARRHIAAKGAVAKRNPGASAKALDGAVTSSGLTDSTALSGLPLISIAMSVSDHIRVASYELAN